MDEDARRDAWERTALWSDLMIEFLEMESDLSLDFHELEAYSLWQAETGTLAEA